MSHFKRIRLGFLPSDYTMRSSLLLIRNNLTGLEPVVLYGRGVTFLNLLKTTLILVKIAQNLGENWSTNWQQNGTIRGDSVWHSTNSFDWMCQSSSTSSPTSNYTDCSSFSANMEQWWRWETIICIENEEWW